MHHMLRTVSHLISKAQSIVVRYHGNRLVFSIPRRFLQGKRLTWKMLNVAWSTKTDWTKFSTQLNDMHTVYTGIQVDQKYECNAKQQRLCSIFYNGFLKENA